MKRTLYAILPTALVLSGLTLCCFILWNQTGRFRRSVERIAEDVRVSIFDLDGKVVYDTAGQDLPNHSARAEFEAVKADGRARSIVRESETLHMAMFYHARRIGDYILRIAVPYQAVSDARIYARRGLLAAIGIGALIVLTLFFFTRRYEQRLAHLAAERDLQDKLLGEMRKLEQFRRDFISNVTHEIRTPVTGILGAVELLANTETSLDAQDRTELHNVLKEQSARLNALVDDILALAQLERTESEHDADFAPCRLADIVENAINLCRPLALTTGTEIILSADRQLIRQGEAHLLESAVSNLVQNALRHSGSDSVEVTVEATDDGRAAIRVTDHGVGIPMECQARLFERFYRIDRNRSRAQGGTGLGLAIVKHIAQLHGGEVFVASLPGQGATFTLVI